MFFRHLLQKNFRHHLIYRRFSEEMATETQLKKPSAGPVVSGNVPGLSEAVFKIGDEPVGPGASKNADYKNPEYFCYSRTSYFDAELEMLKYRCPQPTNKN